MIDPIPFPKLEKFLFGIKLNSLCDLLIFSNTATTIVSEQARESEQNFEREELFDDSLGDV